MVTRPSAGPPPPRAPVLPPRVTRGLSSYWCTTVSSPSGGPCTPIGPVWRVCWPRLSRSLSERACPHWCSCRAVAAGYSFPVAPSVLAPPWVWTASPPSVSRVSPLPLERSRSTLLCGKARQPCRDSRPSFGSGPRGPRSALRSPGLLTAALSSAFLCTRVYHTVLRSRLRSRCFCRSSLLSLLWFVFSCCFAGLVIMYWILDTADVLGCQAMLSVCMCLCPCVSVCVCFLALFIYLWLC